LRRTKEQYKAYAAHKYHHYKEWLSEPWWFQEKEPLAKFTGWVAAFTFVLVIVAALQLCTLEKTDQTLNQTFLVGNRAWISPITIALTDLPVNGKPISIGLTYNNVGKLPALDLHERYTLSSVPNKAIDDGTAMVVIDKSDICQTVEPWKDAEVAYPNSGGRASDTFAQTN
jgi:hypothetical protein